jgi:hypothetical protein
MDTNIGQRLTGVGLALLVASCSDARSPTQLHPGLMAPAFQQTQNAVDDAAFGFTAGWLRGQTVQFFYHKQFFCRTPVADGNPVGSATACEAGSDGTVDPRLGSIPILYVMTPLGFRPADATLQCPIVGQCINHPSTIDLSRLFGPGAANAPLPAHSHIVDQVEGNWWELHVIGVKDPATWDQIVAGKSLATVRTLQAADPTGAKITPEILTNVYLFFDVRSGTTTP